MDLTRLRGSNQALIRVIASDGFNSAQAQSQANFSVARHAPVASIYAPGNGHLYTGDQAVVLRGLALDIEDGMVDDAHLSWSSNLNGQLGTGSSLTVNAAALQEGTHTISLTATDADGQTGAGTGLAPGSYNGHITITAPGAATRPQTIPVSLIVSAPDRRRPVLGCKLSGFGRRWPRHPDSRPIRQPIKRSNSSLRDHRWHGKRGERLHGSLRRGQFCSW